MNRTLAVAVTLTALAQPLMAQTKAAAPQGAQVADEAFARAFKANDVEGLVAVYADGAVLYPPGAMAQRGRDAIRKGGANAGNVDARRSCVCTTSGRNRSRAAVYGGVRGGGRCLVRGQRRGPGHPAGH